MPTSYQDLRFTQQQIAIMKRIRCMKRIKRINIDKEKKGKYAFLFKYSLIDFANNEHTYYKLSDKGVMYLLYHRESAIKFYLPLFLSIVAIIISIIALIKQ